MAEKLGKILLIESVMNLRSQILTALEPSYSILTATDRAEALLLSQKEHFDLVIFDIDISDCDAFQLCAELKNHGQWHGKPVVFLAANPSVEDKIKGFAVGADDYVIKPFDPRELLARIQAKMRTLTHLNRGRQVADLWLDFEKQLAYSCIENGRRPLHLTPKEFRLLAFFLIHKETVLNRNQIIQNVWSNEANPTDRCVDVQVSSLRRKMKGLNIRIRTVYKAGYMMTEIKSKSAH